MKKCILSLAVAAVAIAHAQTPSPGPASGYDVSIAADALGNAYFTSQNGVFKLDQSGFTRVAGNSSAGYSGDGGPATAAQLNLPLGVAVDGAGNLFVADAGNHAIRRVSADGIISTVAGNGIPSYDGDGGLATSAHLNYPQSLALDGAGNLFVADSLGLLGFTAYGNRIRRISPDGIISTVLDGAGDASGFHPALLTGPNRLAADASGNLFITEPLRGRVLMLSPDGTLSLIAGRRAEMSFRETCAAGINGNGGPAALAPLCLPYGVAVDQAGNLFITEYGYRCCYDLDDPIIEDFAVRRIAQEGIITTVAGSATPGVSACDCADIASGSVAVDGSGNLFLSDSVMIWKIAADGTVTLIPYSPSNAVRVLRPAK